jgi:hypothetical protein
MRSASRDRAPRPSPPERLRNSPYLQATQLVGPASGFPAAILTSLASPTVFVPAKENVNRRDSAP